MRGVPIEPAGLEPCGGGTNSDPLFVTSVDQLRALRSDLQAVFDRLDHLILDAAPRSREPSELLELPRARAIQTVLDRSGGPMRPVQIGLAERHSRATRTRTLDTRTFPRKDLEPTRALWKSLNPEVPGGVERSDGLSYFGGGDS